MTAFLIILGIAAVGGATAWALFSRSAPSAERVVHAAQTYETPLETLLHERAGIIDRIESAAAWSGLASTSVEIDALRSILRTQYPEALLAAARDREPLEQELKRLRDADAARRARIAELEDEIRGRLVDLAEYRRLLPDEEKAAARELAETVALVKPGGVR